MAAFFVPVNAVKAFNRPPSLPPSLYELQPSREATADKMVDKNAFRPASDSALRATTDKMAGKRYDCKPVQSSELSVQSSDEPVHCKPQTANCKQ